MLIKKLLKINYQFFKMKNHDLDILSKYFKEIKNGNKNFELRKNSKNYKIGDYITLHEIKNEFYTNKKIKVKIKYILKNCEKYGLHKDFVILSF